ncbi:MAG: hypothetical protein NTZ44_03435 [Candidatus Nomurabacteria bacterium]|nr:hypothetical protein [Candidatus Nomurabacteria bacterium]
MLTINTKTKHSKDIKDKNEIIDRNVAIYFNMASISPPLELHLALVRDLLKRGNKVTAYICDSSFSSPMDNPFNRRSIERFKMFRAKDALKGLDVELKIINLEKISTNVSKTILSILEMAVMSSFASILKAQSKEELSQKWLAAYDNMFLSAKKLYNFFIDEIKKEKYDFVFMFNGRFGDVKPVLQATKDSEIGFGLSELKRTTLEVVFVNELVHSIAGNTKRAIASYEKDKKLAENNAKIFFAKKFANKETGDPLYTIKQKKGSLSERVKNTTKKVITVYPTTDDEYKFIGKEWDGHVPEDQVAEIEKIAIALPPEEYLIIVKMHPNQEHTAEDTIGRYTSLANKYTHVEVEKPLSSRDTYALMLRADVVVVFASLIGVEASYAGKPVVLIGDTTWGNLNIAHKLYSGEDAGNLIKNGIEPKPILGSIIWGNYCIAYEDDLPEFKILEKGNYFVAGKRIGKSTWRRIIQLPAKTEIMINRPGFKFGVTFILKIIDTAINIAKGKWATQ